LGESAATALARTAVEPIEQDVAIARSAPWWYLFFFVSGFPALLYQIVWQRSLFTLFGVNIESVTMVVTAFMLGLGLGSLLGGKISRYQHLPLLAIFGLIELLIGIYGIFSLKIFHWAATFTAGSPTLKTGLVAFTLVALPTVLMGSTLPLLVSHTVRLSHNVGTSVGALYAANTLGSAAACFCAGLFLMRFLGEWKTVAFAAALNAIVGASVLVRHYILRGRQSSTLDSSIIPAHPSADAIQPKTNQSAGIAFAAAVITAGIAGFISLGYEIIWYRLFSFTTGGEAKSFAFLLGSYLAGIAAGSHVSNRVCEKITDLRRFTRFLAATVLGANLLGFLVGPILFNLVLHYSYLWSLLPIGLAAACLGAVFPLLCHISINPNEHVGARISYLYLSNIAGSALGSYLTGFIFMDAFSLRQVCVGLTLLGLALGIALMLKANLGRRNLTASALAVSVAALFVVWGSQPLYREMYEKLQFKSGYALKKQLHAFKPFKSIVETKSGIITVTQERVVFGGGIYDGRFSVSLVDDTNGLQRPFSLSYFHPHPKEVLMVGLSSGSWAQVIANHPQVEHLTIVEINPGYLRLIQQNPEVASVLKNPKVHIDIDDGRRWLVRNSGRKFDAIVMNSTFNWRSNVSNLLSAEFLQLVRQHLNPGGIHFYNATDSDEVMATALRVFPFGMRVGSFMMVSDAPFPLSASRWLQVLSHYTIDGAPVFDLSQPQHRHRLLEVVSMPKTIDRDVSGSCTLESADHIRARTANARTITDDNMGTEWLR
jgi:predicted membrane-bound spermidine synthase